ncbi:MAG: hypothetical protein V1747_05150 [Candidatus Omnitrophota bacterium]
MEKNKNFIFGSIYDVLRFLILGLVTGMIVGLCLFSVRFDVKNYDIVFTSRINNSIYYGVEYGTKIELWKIERSEDGSLCTRRIYP